MRLLVLLIHRALVTFDHVDAYFRTIASKQGSSLVSPTAYHLFTVNLAITSPSRRGIIVSPYWITSPVQTSLQSLLHIGFHLRMASILWRYYLCYKYPSCLTLISFQLKVLWPSLWQFHPFRCQYSVGMTNTSCLIFSSLSFRISLVL